MEYGGIGEGSSSSMVTLPIPTAVYSSSAVCGGIDGGASVLSSVTGLSYGFFITSVYKSSISIVYGGICGAPSSSSPAVECVG